MLGCMPMKAGVHYKLVYGCGQMYAKMLGMWASMHGCVHDYANWCERICAMGVRVWVCTGEFFVVIDILGFLVFRYI